MTSNHGPCPPKPDVLLPFSLHYTVILLKPLRRLRSQVVPQACPPINGDGNVYQGNRNVTGYRTGRGRWAPSRIGQWKRAWLGSPPSSACSVSRHIAVTYLEIGGRHVGEVEHESDALGALEVAMPSLHIAPKPPKNVAQVFQIVSLMNINMDPLETKQRALFTTGYSTPRHASAGWVA